MNRLVSTIFNIAPKSRRRPSLTWRKPAGFGIEIISATEENKILCFYCKHLTAEKYCGVCVKYYCKKCAHKSCEAPSGVFS
ncbi:MAG: hypothetical protein A2667_02880 [Candidatus Wildermuthbacteria bacterium RIFCSPHIGHO2_01_FULL_47_27]|uniref:Uncharacterized protein n=2 Tax=Candidatus Wildermuthiibacteriota TaxID=1817923 RepID=A0A1G2RTW5_9BACT|nr:MAG: hypothetical protein A2667_02880 [Candidatus Wildermuthbacteria bacterium RIFCSPHIGHO2_01_FULL_47_27]OHA66945.1 MAG: hypothetical protein A3D59_01825 [Candidatus Wildermuthbacteria bacterium RIFCSPHIGHO2_02_FULL_47_17]OHA75829.1 MAG: hypothetical protein A3A32_02080 [Candidatus Wildermuthbacteria bacterium RIFCSPLOWO2_01_FULL_48_35]OHA76553.1 MAG: hypothetical protein A3I38_03735 [Candidatus Wildermuthbacteria bacterium RIFCSPLOWO2_02_FULL_47_10]